MGYFEEKTRESIESSRIRGETDSQIWNRFLSNPEFVKIYEERLEKGRTKEGFFEHFDLHPEVSPAPEQAPPDTFAPAVSTRVVSKIPSESLMARTEVMRKLPPTHHLFPQGKALPTPEERPDIYEGVTAPLMRTYELLLGRPGHAIAELVYRGMTQFYPEMKVPREELRKLPKDQQKAILRRQFKRERWRTYWKKQAELHAKSPEMMKIRRTEEWKQLKAQEKGYWPGLANQLLTTGEELSALIFHFGLMGAALPGTAVARGISPIKHLTKLGLYKFLTTPGDEAERAKASAWIMAYSATPWIVGAMGRTGMGAILSDIGLNTFLSSPQYIEIAKQSRSPQEFIANALPITLTDIAMSLSTRGLPENQRTVKAYRLFRQANPKVKMPYRDFQKALKDANKSIELLERISERGEEVPGRVKEAVTQEFETWREKARPTAEGRYTEEELIEPKPVYEPPAPKKKIVIIGEDKSIFNRMGPKVQKFLKSAADYDVYIVPKAELKVFGRVGDRPMDINIGKKALRDDMELNTTILHEAIHKVELGDWNTPLAKQMREEWRAFNWKEKTPGDLHRMGFKDNLWTFKEGNRKAIEGTEFMAEMAEEYLGRPQNLKKNAKPIYDFFDKYIGEKPVVEKEITPKREEFKVEERVTKIKEELPRRTPQEEAKFLRKDLNTERDLARDWLNKVQRDLKSPAKRTRMGARKRLPEAREQSRDLTQRTIKQHAQVLAESELNPNQKHLVNWVTAIRQAERLSIEQSEIVSRERGKRMAEARKIVPRGEKEAREFMAKFTGKIEKIEFEALDKKLSQADKDAIFREVHETPRLLDFERLPAMDGLRGLLEGRLPTRSQIRLLNRALGSDFTKTLLDKRPLLERMKALGFEIANIPRAILTSADLSFGLRQGIFIAPRHPGIFAKSFFGQFKWFGNEKASEAVIEEMRSRKNYELAKKSGLALTERHGELTAREEAYMGAEIAEKIPIIGPIIRASNRAYTTFANKFRMDTFDFDIENAKRLGLNPDKNPKLAKAIAERINIATGRGTLGAFEKVAVELNTAFFSPRLFASRVQILNPARYIKESPYVRQEALKTLFAFTGYVTSTLALAKLAGAKVETDPTSADFLKIKIGNTRIDIMGGLQQYIVLTARFIDGSLKSTTTGKRIKLGEGYRPLTRWDIFTRFGEMKFAPLFSFATTLMRGQTVIGEKVSVLKEVGKRLVPMVMQDVYDIKKDDPTLLPLSTLGVFGMGLQTYKRKLPVYKPIKSLK